MKKYVKPTFEFIELRSEESLANNGSGTNCASGAQKCGMPSWDNPH